MKKNIITGLALAILMAVPTTVTAEEFWKSGTVSRVLVDAKYYGKCMINLPFDEYAGCKGGWISLDCQGEYLEKGDGDRMLNLALIAQTMEKKVSVKIDNSKKHNDYCIAVRFDILK